MNFAIKAFGAHALLLDWTAHISESTHQELLAVDDYLNTHFQKEIIETVIAYHSLVVYLKANVNKHFFCKKIGKANLQITSSSPPKTQRIIELPVCYDQVYGLDLAYLSELHQVDVGTIIKWHTAPIYRVYFIGFLPGFPYLGGLDERLHTPRRAMPRPRLSKGAVGIGGKQTGVYPQDSPGGWHIMGYCPVNLFEPMSVAPSLLSAGSLVRFVSISKAELQHINVNPHFQPKTKLLND